MHNSITTEAEVLAAENVHNEGYLFGTLIAILIAVRILDELFGHQLLARLRTEDTLRGKVHLRGFGKIWLWGNQLVFTTFLLYSLYVHSVTLATIFFLVSAAHGLYMLNILSTRIEITETLLSYRTIFQTRIIDTSVICKAYWVSKGRSFGYTLVLKLTNGRSVEFPQIYFVGLNDLWKRFGDGK